MQTLCKLEKSTNILTTYVNSNPEYFNLQKIRCNIDSFAVKVSFICSSYEYDLTCLFFNFRPQDLSCVGTVVKLL